MKIGDTVYLNSGSPPLKVTATNQHRGNVFALYPTVTCECLDENGDLKEFVFDLRTVWSNGES